MVGSEAPIQVEADVPAVTKKQVKTPNEPKTKAPKAPKAIKEPKAAAPKAAKASKVNESKTVVPEPEQQAVAVPLRENKASSDGKFYLMPNFPKVSFSYNGQTYFRTETDNVYDNMTLEMIGVWDHLNHEIITAFDDEEVEDLFMSDEE